MSGSGGAVQHCFVDPPYTQELKPLLELIAGSELLEPTPSWWPSTSKTAVAGNCGRLSLYREAPYGDTVLAFYKAGASGQEPEARSEK